MCDISDGRSSWTEERIEEKLNHGTLATSVGQAKVCLGWRLLKSNREDVAFNVYPDTTTAVT
ncbi:MAG: rhamnogalacturonan endolyase family protein [Planctomycetota bacterium]|jgi:hypothetical protein